jgi:hypothetical protein
MERCLHLTTVARIWGAAKNGTPSENCLNALATAVNSMLTAM